MTVGPPRAAGTASYTGGGLAESARAWTELVDHAAATAGSGERARMRAGFLTSSRYELAFRDMAARLETWPV